MRRFMLPAAVMAVLIAVPAHAQSDRAPKAGDRLPPKAAEPAPDATTRPNTIEALFERLGKAKDETEAQGIANLIERRWSRSGSDTADLLMSRAGEAFRDKEYGLAIELLDRVLTLRRPGPRPGTGAPPPSTFSTIRSAPCRTCSRPSPASRATSAPGRASATS
jgi:hypothetical protein